MKLQTRLLLTIVGTAILVVGIVMGVASLVARSALEDAAQNKLLTLNAARSNALMLVLEESKAKLQQLAVAPSTVTSLVDFTHAFRQLGPNAQIRLQQRYVVENLRPRWERDLHEITANPDAYDQVHTREHGRYRDRRRLFGWEDVLLIDPQGNVVYSILKAQDFATNLLTGTWKNTGLARAVKPLLQDAVPGVPSFADFDLYKPNGNLPAGFLALPVFDSGGHALVGAVAMQLPTALLNKLMQDKTGLGETGEAILVGRNGLMLTDSRLGQQHAGLRTQLQMVAVDSVLAGHEGIIVAPDYRGIPALTAFKPFHPFPGALGEPALWGVIAKMDQAEALSGLGRLQHALFGVGALIAFFATLLGVWVARNVGRPILAIQTALAKLARGEEAVVPGVERRDEIGDMARAAESFRVMARQIERSHWLKESLTGLTTAVSSQTSMEQVPDAVLGYLCRILNVPVAALYFADSHQVMVRAGIHGLARRSQAEDRFPPGIGLVGQTARDRQPMILSQVPEGLGIIGSGVAEFAPAELVLYPVLHKQEVLAVLELATLHPLTAAQHEFLGAASTGLGLHLANLKSAEHNRVLLAATREQAATLEEQRQRIEQASHYARSLIEAALDPLVTISAEGRIMDVNNATEQVTGLTREQLVGSDFSDYFTEPAKARAGYRQVFAQGKVIDYPLAIRHVSGKITDVLYNASVFYDRNGELAGVFAAARDVTELRQQQETLRQNNEEMKALAEELKAQNEEFRANQEELRAQQEEMQHKNLLLEAQGRQLEQARREAEAKANELQRANQFKSQFLANMSHELRTPLNSILILARNLAENETGNLDADQVESATVISDSGSHLLTLINDILDLSKIEAGRLELSNEAFPLAEMVTFLQRSFSPLAEKKGIGFGVSIAPSVPERIDGDRQRITQMLTNLLSNAVKFTDSGEVRLGARMEGTDLCFDVSDTGIGIPSDKLERIFGAFQQLDGSTSRKYGGSGLGLAITRRLVELMGGSIGVESTPGRGSTFSLRWPLALSAGQTAPAPKSEALRPPLSAPSPAPVTGPCAPFMVVEDDAQLVAILNRLIDTLGFGVVAVDTGEKALAQIGHTRPAGVLLDLGLPGMQGMEVLRRLKADAKLAEIPVFIMSGAEDSGEAKTLGALGYLRKPVTKEAIASAIRAMLERAPAATRQTVLVVEDDEADVRDLRALFHDDPLDLVAIANGKDALQWLRSGHADAVILDLVLPDCSGFDWLEQLARDAAQPPVIVHSAREVTDEELFQLRQRAEAVVTKGKSNARLREEVLLALRAKPAAKRPPAAPAARGQRLLLVDDDVRSLFALAKALRSKGYAVEMAPSGAKALELLQQQVFDAALSDIMMPEMDGYTLIRRIRALGYKKLPIIAVTAKAMPGDIDLCLQAGANDYVTKPVDIDFLLGVLSRWL